MSATDVTFQLLDGQLAASEEEVLALRAEVYGAAAGAGEHARRFQVWRRQPGFALAAAWHGEYLVGYACGMPLRPSTSWWKELTTPLPADVTAEHPGRTFALADLAVRASWRRQGIAGSLYRLLMDARSEERATLTVPPGATAAQRAFRNWGWRKVARTRDPGPGPGPGPDDTPVLDVLLLTLRT